MTRVILASTSPRRKELLQSTGIPFDVHPSNVPEEHKPGELPHDYVARLSRDKAEAIAKHHHRHWIIGADTTVYLDEQLLEKPKNRADAIRMLSLLAGRTHVVYTGVTLANRQENYSDTRVAESEVRMLALSREDIEWYVDTGEPMDKAGAYAVQGIGAMFIDSVHGNYTNIVGLPLALLFQMLRRAGIDPLRARSAM
jgi:septum formation protein